MNKTEETITINEAITRIECALIGNQCADETAQRQVRRVLEQYAQQVNKEAIELIEYFVKRVEDGSIRSRVTYKKYKDFLDSFNHQNQER